MSQWISSGLCGGAAGLVNGILGAGGGIVLIPLLRLLGKLESKQAFATSLSIMLPITLCSIVLHLIYGPLPLQEAVPYMLGGLLGGLVGGAIFGKVPPKWLHMLFGALILWGGGKLLWQSLPF